ncbi:dynamin family protein [Hippea maritima]|uniref:Dynamin family protein n=1 Tax=Hippea maritima (strain ATCC 700847 / DSM 10411 / MH2) TaxID=760142 RepID=F2LUQ5_HIPMA|nr:dynamin family protein [Hippea maritima]AEA33510.1 Dynamin family protein [Hippea maritima DSM 10411]
MTNIKEKLLKSISAVEVISGKELSKTKEKLLNEQFNLVVIGQFKRGKSTLINALLGDDIVPSSILPLTSIVTIISYSQAKKAIVKFLDNSKEEIELEKIEKYVTEKHNPKNKLNVKEVHVFHPSPYLKKGIRIIDTPGIGSVFKHNTDVAYSFLPYCDAAVFVMSPDPPLGEAEIGFLKNVRTYTEKFFFVLNKIDMVSEKELDEVIEFNKHFLEDYTKTKGIKIYPISAKNALKAKQTKDSNLLKESRISEFENELDEFIQKEKGNIITISTINAILRHINNELTSYQIQKQAQNFSLERLKEKTVKFEGFIKGVKEEAEEYEYILDKRIEKIYKELDEEIEKLKEQHLSELIEKMQQHYEEKAKEKPTTEEFEIYMTQKMNEYIMDIFNDFKKEQSEIISNKIEAIYDELAKRINEKIEDIAKTASSIFEIKLNSYIDKEKLIQKSYFYFMLQDQMGILNIFATTFRTKLPFFIGKKIAYKHIKNTTIELFDRHCGRVRYDLTKRVRETTFRFKDQLKDKLDLTIESIEKALNKAIQIKTESQKKALEVFKTIEHNTKLLSKEKEELEKLKQQLS